MTIYAWPGIAVRLVEARIAPLWIEKRPSEIKHHYSEPKKTKRTKEIEATADWLAKAVAIDDGKPLGGGKWLKVYLMKADDGFREINETFAGLVGAEEMAKFDKWRRADGPAAADLWPTVTSKEVHY